MFTVRIVMSMILSQHSNKLTCNQNKAATIDIKTAELPHPFQATQAVSWCLYQNGHYFA